MWEPKAGGRQLIAVMLAASMLMASCSNNSNSDQNIVASDNTETSLDEISSTTAPATSAPDTTTSIDPASTTSDVTTTSSAAGQPVDGPVFVVISDAVLGWWDGASWVKPDGDGEQIPALRGQTLRSVTGNDQVLVGDDPSVGCFPEDGRGTWWIEGSIPGVGVSGEHILQPRPVEIVAAAPAHFEAIGEVLASDGVEAEVEISRVIRFDLEGDGVDEVIIEANRLDGTPLWNLGPGNYSIILFRRLRADSTVENIIIHADTEPPPLGVADSLTVANFEELADVNGDGIFELATSYYGYEWGGSNLWDLAGSPTKVLGSGCGS